MYGGKQRGGFGKVLAGLAFFILICFLFGRGAGQMKLSLGEALKQVLAAELADAIYVQFMPGMAEFAGESSAGWLVRAQTGSLLPLYGMVQGEGDEYTYGQVSEDGAVSQVLENNNNSEARSDVGFDGEAAVDDLGKEKDAAFSEDALQAGNTDQSKEELLALMEAENQTASAPAPFVPHEQRMEVNLEELADYETLVKSFYTIDGNTSAGDDELNAERFLKQDLRLDKSVEGPQILIYHTHSQEAFADSVSGDEDTTIVGVGKRLATILQDVYGYQVLHHTGQYDVDTRDDAYGKALPAVQEILTENPSIEVVIDLHRDQMPEENKLVMNLDGRPTARFMFFNGLSRTIQSGDIDYLKNDNLDENLAFSFQMQLKCEEYYPGLTRKIYLKGYRYNMHLRPKTLLVELGAQNNTVEEAMNACDPLAHVLNMVLSGE